MARPGLLDRVIGENGVDNSLPIFAFIFLVALGIDCAGIILAGTFSVLMTLPVWFIFNIGFLVALGILLDTFVVRTIMVPAAVELLGDRIWWPSSAKGGRAALREAPTAPEPEPARTGS